MYSLRTELMQKMINVCSYTCTTSNTSIMLEPKNKWHINMFCHKNCTLQLPIKLLYLLGEFVKLKAKVFRTRQWFSKLSDLQCIFSHNKQKFVKIHKQFSKRGWLGQIHLEEVISDFIIISNFPNDQNWCNKCITTSNRNVF